MKVALYIGAAAMCAFGFAYTMYRIFYGTPLMGWDLYFNQKIVYYHVPSAFMLFAAVFICGIFGQVYLRTRNDRWDDIAFAGGELAVMFGSIVLVTGSLWAKAAWGKWWVWDARLTSALVLWMTMVAYLLVRKYGGAGSQRLSAGLGVFASINIPLVYMSTRLWNTQHPPTTKMNSSMSVTLWLMCLPLFLVFFTLLLRLRIDVRRAERRIYQCRELALDAGVFE